MLVGLATLFCTRAGFAQNPPNIQGQANQGQTTQNQNRSQQDQTQDPALKAPSNLSEENLARVAASADQITEVLRKQTGLMVELKRWLAADATNHGQVVEDEDLTDQAVLDRVGNDVAFRSIATRLLQRYGYLLPKFNPGSEMDLQDQLHWQAQQLELQREFGIGEKSQGAAQQAPTRTTQQNGAPNAAPLPSGTLGSPLASPALPELPIQRTPSDQQDLTPGLMRASAGNPDLQADIQSAAGASGAATGGANIDSERVMMNRELNERSAVGEPAGNRSMAPGTPASASGTSPNERGGAPMAERQPNTRAEADQPVMVHEPNPFSYVPSLYDLYQRVSTRTSELKPFGEDALRLHGDEAAQLPMDLPAGPDYVVGPGDGLEIDLWGGASGRFYRVVDREGRVSLPEVGPLPVSGRSMDQVQTAVQQALRSQFRDASADVSLARLRTVRVYVVGEVENPGAYDISSLSTALNALVTAGGTTPRGTLRRVRHMRGNQLVEEVDVYDLLLRGVRAGIQPLESGDTLQVPPAGPRVTIEGMVRRPAIYELRDETNLAQVLELAGGILPTASLRHIEVERVEAHDKRTILSLDLPMGDDAAIAKQFQAFAVHDGDRIRILPIGPSTQDAVYLEGHVLRSGRYSYKAGMRVTDLFSSYNDLMPEPDSYAEIIRLVPPDFHPEVESFDLAAALAKPAASPKLDPLDTVRIYSRYDFVNVPTVMVGGEVRRPGGYHTTGQVHLRDAVYEAGGVTQDAALDSAQLIRYNPDGSLKITTVNLAKALAGDPMENLLLQPRDRLLVHRNAQRVDPPTVYVRGEVSAPGRFPLTGNLRVSDLIALGGGLKRSAFSRTADLTRYVGSDPNKEYGGEHFQIDLAQAMAGDPSNDFPLRDGDVLTISRIPGWEDRGASVTVAGEVMHPGSYGIRPGEHLSSLLARMGGFLPTAYPRATVFERVDVRQLQEKTRQDLISRVQQQVANVKVSIDASATETAALQQAALEQRQRVLEALQNAPVTGRMVVHIPLDLKNFAGSPDDIELRAGDTLTIPKRPEFVVVGGQVFNANALTWEPRKTVGWYLSRAGGPTQLADKGGIFVIRADGSVVSGRGSDWWSHNIQSVRVEPGDSIIVPEKALGGSQFWRNLIAIAQIAEGGAITAAALKTTGI
jgi:protein involved in polysaccharide export with SLBB domain